ncbi:MAG: hypothetical protein A3G76_07435 [Acidobacteria bacterium RIFCSPLOWO2_12_FULL_65_11]|nr:MAG: hypothetical protein A3H95_13630 [Acidobacteria bacterium RIFCSPLOWO2_02_FULL_64_15]OFW29466.1 MAG: hypothetical protein A3G76_07435 [Acidobacteria bacterium RIFCSPLOWO2_12_FULL_65_11]
MELARRPIALAGVLLGIHLIVTPRLAAQSATLKGDLLNDWLSMKDAMMKIADAMPEEKFSFKTTPPQRTFGEQILHVADGNRIGMGMLGSGVAPPTIDMKATGKADILKALADSYDFGAAVISAQTDQSLLETVRTLPFLGATTRARVIWFDLEHAWDIYGQMVVYLRVNGIVPPASQRP